MMTEHNERVIEVLNRYITEGPEPHYAIMLNGAWGCGKTYFIRERWLKQIEDTEKYSIINVSLFGVKNINELKEEIAYNKIILEEAIERSDKANKPLDKAKKLANTNGVKEFSCLINKILESKVGIRFNDVSKIFTHDWLSKDKEGITRVLILDDLERAKMDLKEIFGFVSSYIESTGLRVIFLSNDDEISKTEKVKIKEETSVEEVKLQDITDNKDISKYNKGELNSQVVKIANNKKTITTKREMFSDEDYHRIREKVIGETLRIEADIDDALLHFFKEMKYLEEEIKIIEPLIREIRRTLSYNNLRVVRQTLMKLQLLYRTVISSKYYDEYKYSEIEIAGSLKPKDAYVKNVVKFFILANMKKVMGDLNAENLWLAAGVNGLGLYKPLTQLDEQNSVWVNYIWGGELDKDVVRKAVDEDMQALIPQEIKEKDSIFKLQVGYWKYSKEEFYRLQSKMINELRQGFYTEIMALMQAYCLLITFEKDGILREVDNVDELFDEVLDKVKVCEPEGSKTGRNSVDYMKVELGGYRGYQLYYSVDKKRVAKFLDRVKKEYKKSKEVNMSISINELVSEIIESKKDVYQFYDKFEQFQPTLEWVGSDTMWRLLDKIQLEEQRVLFSTLNSRYGLNSLGCEDSCLAYKSEEPILESLVEGYTKRYEKAKEDKDNKVSMYCFLKVDSERTLNGFKDKMKKGEEVKLEL
jgi:hypothetical protein